MEKDTANIFYINEATLDKDWHVAKKIIHNFDAPPEKKKLKSPNHAYNFFPLLTSQGRKNEF